MRPSSPARRRGRRIGIVVALAALVLGSGAHAVVSPAAAAQTILNEDFSGDLSNWTNQSGRRNVGPIDDPKNWGTGEIQTYSALIRHTNVTGGNLVITPELTSSGWRSGRIQSKTPFRVAEGEKVQVQARIALPTGGAGFWPAFWLLADGTWPLDGEIDIMENVNQAPEYFNTLHCGVTPGGPCHENQGMDARTSCGNCAEFNAYGVIIDRGSDPSLTWTFNGTPVHTVTGADFPNDPDAFAAVLDSDYRVVINLAIGGTFPAFYDPDYESKMDKTVGLKSPLRVAEVTITKI